MDPVVIRIACILTALLFISAGGHKLSAPEYYRTLIMKYVPVPKMIAKAIQLVLGLAELGMGMLMLLPMARQQVAWLAVAFLVFYLLLIAVSLLRGLDMDCGCSSPLNKQKLSPWLLFRNVVLIIVALMATTPATDRMLGWSDNLLILLVSSAAILIYISFEQILVNQEKLILLRSQ